MPFNMQTWHWIFAAVLALAMLILPWSEDKVQRYGYDKYWNIPVVIARILLIAAWVISVGGYLGVVIYYNITGDYRYLPSDQLLLGGFGILAAYTAYYYLVMERWYRINRFNTWRKYELPLKRKMRIAQKANRTDRKKHQS